MAKDDQESGRSTVADPVTDEDLQSALAEALEAAGEGEEEAPAEEATPEEPETPPQEAAQEEPPPPPAQEEPTDPRERTALGRKVKGLELEIQRLQQQLLQRQLAPTKTSAENQTDDDGMPEFVTTPDELRKALKIIQREEQEKVQGYQIGYGQRFLEIGKEDPLYDEIEQEMMANFNRRETGNPAIDAELNYNRAKASVLTKKMATPATPPPAPPPKIPGKGDKPQGSGVTIASRNARPASAPPQLDEHAADFIKRTGMSEDSIRSALGASKPRR